MTWSTFGKAFFGGLLGLTGAMALVTADGVTEEWELWTAASATLVAAGVTTREVQKKEREGA